MRVRYTAVALMSCGSISARAQTIQGYVRDGDSRQPIAGAVVTVFSPSDTVVGRAVSGQNGQYKVSARNASNLRVVRIGYRPRELALDRHVADSIEIDVTMNRLPTMLEPVRVTRSAQCAKDASDERAYGLLQQARAGLLATIAARELLPAKMVRLNFDRTAARGGDEFGRQRVYIDSGADLRVSFASAR
ncbi:MAG TPA: carboxypeptidase-like regulatory domain-containing protein, partial [Gemmatimonadaceae bacterium]|nr:carboxypeptidase-like regulatory domain-containing protein [Gemmatimonadaceae bacterium]